MNVSTDVTSGEIKVGKKNKVRTGILSKEHLFTTDTIYNKCLPHINCSCLQCDFKQVKLLQCFDLLADCGGPQLYPSLCLKKPVAEKLKCKQGTLNLCLSSS